MQHELVSIITPMYNSSKYILETLNSVFNQTHQHFEIILIDDASTDNTLQCLPKDNRIKIIRLNKNSGSAVARNEGIKLAKGKYLTFLDADDLWFPNFIEKSIQTIKTSKINFVFASYKRLDENLNPLLKDFIVPLKVTYSDILKTNSISCLTAFINIEVLGKKYMPLVRKRQDMGLWLQYLKEIKFAYGIKEPLAIYRIRKNSLSRNKWKLIKSQWDFYRKVENLNIIQSIYYFIAWVFYGILKYKN
ncbi:glycosyltransferase family 2 protein [Sabulilitoribacter arenilitoris]|uniref:Glycosyltransferase family 2 protein n=1 Tax=Wocania arenilitoris TaxID=2044858 RepID=A0AAE3JN20_9FLAO|nr:glycosyltransferase family 2 protein [Wocania arenilitoris]MCF7566785.1 glycosyltransferase family 2 protein [Wocania arenilitoris]